MMKQYSCYETICFLICLISPSIQVLTQCAAAAMVAATVAAAMVATAATVAATVTHANEPWFEQLAMKTNSYYIKANDFYV